MFIVFSIWPFFVFGQINSNFESGLSGWEQFPENRWESSPDNALSGNSSLHHVFDNSVSATDYISCKTGTLIPDSSISWEFKISHGYAPSSSNKWQIYLASDIGAADLTQSSPNAWEFGVNISGSDDTLALYTLRNGSHFLLCKTSVNFEKDIGTAIFHCLISRNSEHLWEIRGAKDESELKSIGSFQEPSGGLTNLRNFMISYTYTSTRDRLLWFDDLIINASINIDTVAPALTSFKKINRNTLKLIFSESPGGNIQKENFTLFPGAIHPEKISVNKESIFCYFSAPFTQKTRYTLVAEDIGDMDGNILEKDSISFFMYEAERNDIVITEIMADPSPPVYLSEQEYVELFNRTDYSIDLDSFKLITGAKEWLIKEFNLPSKSYLVITSGSVASSNVLPLFTSTLVITNSGQRIILKNNYGQIITAAEFTDDWYGDDFKSEGGWSLEKIDPETLCGGKENWTASKNNLGGTPGWENSVIADNPDILPLSIERLEFKSANKIRIIYSKYIDPYSIPGPSEFLEESGWLHADSVQSPEIFCNYTDLIFKENFQENVFYTLIPPAVISDCAGNKLNISGKLQFGLPSSIHLTEVIISEVLFSVLTGCVEFIELYNNSDKLFDLSDLRISVGAPGETGKTAIPISSPVFFFPGDYLVLTKDKKILVGCHEISKPSSIIEAQNLPAFADAGACIKLVNRSLETVDYFCYDPKDHFPMLSDAHGVSLERLAMDNKTGDQSDWHSASSVSGFSTPGEKNSQSLTGIPAEKIFDIQKDVFSPDNDGVDDVLEIRYGIEKEGYLGTIAVFDPVGRLVRYIAVNEILGTSGVIIWDGRNSNGNICSTGLYLIFAEIWNLKGDVQKFKKAVLLVRE